MIPLWLLTVLLYLALLDAAIILTLLAWCALKAYVHERARRGAG